MGAKDKYDLQIEELTKYPERIYDQWKSGIGLFEFADKGRNSSYACGCLSIIRSGDGVVEINKRIDKRLTLKIRADERIPKEVDDITVESLPVFAEWQRKLDKYRTKYK